MVLHGFQVRKKRGYALVCDNGVTGVVGREAHSDGGETRYCFQEHLEILVGRFPLPTPFQPLTGEQKGGHAFCQVGQ